MATPKKTGSDPLVLGQESVKQRLTLIQPTISAAKPRKRHWGLLLSFLFVVVIPVALAGGYLYSRAADQYASTVGFSVRTEEVGSPIEFLGGIAGLSRSSSSDTDILYEYLQSQELVTTLDKQLDLRAIFRGSDRDPLYAFPADGSIEDLVKYWRRMVKVNYDPGTGLIELRVLAFTPSDAQRVARAAFAESSEMINNLSAIARADATRYAREDLDTAVTHLSAAREALTAFRSRAQIVNPEADISTQMGLLGSLQTQLAEALIALDLLRETTGPSDNRVLMAERRIEVIRAHIAEERAKFGIGSTDAEGGDYASIMAEYERLNVEREFGEQAYATALASYYAAQAEARRKSRYLAAYLQPTLAEMPEYPRRLELLLSFTAFAFVAWSIAALIFYSIRDRR